MQNIQNQLNISTTFRLVCSTSDYPLLRLYFIRLGGNTINTENSVSIEGKCGFINNEVLLELARSSLSFSLTLLQNDEIVLSIQNSETLAVPNAADLVAPVIDIAISVNDISEIGEISSVSEINSYEGDSNETSGVTRSPKSLLDKDTPTTKNIGNACHDSHVYGNIQTKSLLTPQHSVENIVKSLEKGRFTLFLVSGIMIMVFLSIFTIIIAANINSNLAFIPILIILFAIFYIVNITIRYKKKNANYKLSKYYNDILGSCPDINKLDIELKNYVLYANIHSKIIITENYLLGYNSVFRLIELRNIIYAGGSTIPSGKTVQHRLTIVCDSGSVFHLLTNNRNDANHTASYLGNNLKIRHGDYEILLHNFRMSHSNFPKPDFLDMCIKYKNYRTKKD